jgi:hypothetical protein
MLERQAEQVTLSCIRVSSFAHEVILASFAHNSLAVFFRSKSISVLQGSVQWGAAFWIQSTASLVLF